MNAAKKKLIVVLTGSLGDIIRGFQIIPALRESGEFDIHWLSDSRWSSFVALHPGIKQVWDFDRKAPLRSARELRTNMSSQHFEVCIDLQRNLKSALLSRLSQARRSIGFASANSREGNYIFHREHIESRDWFYPKDEQYLDFVRLLLGKEVASEASYLSADMFSSSDLSEFSLPDDFSALVLGSSRENKNWPTLGYLRFIQAIFAENKSRFVLLGTGDQQPVAQRLIEGLSSEQSSQVLNLVGKTNLSQLGAVLSRASVCVGPDSGALHLSAAMGVPSVVLFGSTSVRRVAPRGEHVRTVQASLGCSPCERKRCAGLDNLCMRLIRPELVVDAVKSLTA